MWFDRHFKLPGDPLLSPLHPSPSKGQILAALSLVSDLPVPWSLGEMNCRAECCSTWGEVTGWDQNGDADNKGVILKSSHHSHSSENWFQGRPWAGIQEMGQP